jgi:hypothetical protein
MKKETTTVVTVEFTKHHDFAVHDALEGFKDSVREELLQRLKNDVDYVDNITVANVQVFEIEKEERISTEDLINTAKMCAIGDGRYCSTCPCNEGDEDCSDKLVGVLAERLEELHKQQKATPTEQPKEKMTKRKYLLNNLEKFPLAVKEGVDKFTIEGYCPSDFGFADDCKNHSSCTECWNSPCEEDGGEE